MYIWQYVVILVYIWPFCSWINLSDLRGRIVYCTKPRLWSLEASMRHAFQQHPPRPRTPRTDSFYFLPKSVQRLLWEKPNVHMTICCNPCIYMTILFLVNLGDLRGRIVYCTKPRLWSLKASMRFLLPKSARLGSAGLLLQLWRAKEWIC